MLYNAIISIENIIGSDILKMSFMTGIEPILFSVDIKYPAQESVKKRIQL